MDKRIGVSGEACGSLRVVVVVVDDVVVVVCDWSVAVEEGGSLALTLAEEEGAASCLPRQRTVASASLFPPSL